VSKTPQHLNDFFFIISIIGLIGFTYFAIDSLINEDWFGAFSYFFLGLAIFANPLFEKFKKNKRD